MKQPVKILLLEDSPDDVMLIERELQRAGVNFSLVVVSEAEEFTNRLYELKPDVVLSDHSLPGFNSIEAFEIFKKYLASSGVLIPFILVTGEVSEEFAVVCLKAGVDDFVLKDRLKRLPPSIKGALKKCRLENERLKHMSQIIANETLMKQTEHLAGLGSWQYDLINNIQTWSDETYYIYGFAPGEIQPSYELFLSLIHPDDIAYLRDQLERAVKQIESCAYEFRIIDRRGKLKYISCKLQFHRDADGKPVRVIGFNLDVTEKKKADIALNKREQEYRSLFNENPDAVFSLDLQGRITKVNSVFATRIGLPAEEIQGRNFREILINSELERVYPDFIFALERKPLQYECNFVNRAGRRFALDVTVMPIVVEGAIIGSHCVAKDITEKKDLELFLDQAYRTARIGGWQVDVGQQKLTWTAITRELHEVARDYEPDLESAISFYREGESRDTIRQAIEASINSGSPWDLELQIVTDRGHVRWVRVTGEAEMKDGKCLRLYGTFQDIHERKLGEEKLRKAYEEKTNIVESIGDGFVTIDINGTVTYWNNVAETLLNMPREKILGKDIWEVYADTRPLAFYTQYHAAVQTRKPVHFEAYYPALNVWLQVSIYPSASGISAYFRDVTNERMRIEEIENQNKRLREIARIQSHEVRAPLARIMGLINLIDDGLAGKEELEDILKGIKTSAHELDNVVQRIVTETKDLKSVITQ